jgi:hypothetical protein
MNKIDEIIDKLNDERYQFMLFNRDNMIHMVRKTGDKDYWYKAVCGSDVRVRVANVTIVELDDQLLCTDCMLKVAKNPNRYNHFMIQSKIDHKRTLINDICRDDY